MRNGTRREQGKQIESWNAQKRPGNAARSDGNTDRWKGSFTARQGKKLTRSRQICPKLGKKHKIAKLDYEIIGVAGLNSIVHKVKA